MKRTIQIFDRRTGEIVDDDVGDVPEWLFDKYVTDYNRMPGRTAARIAVVDEDKETAATSKFVLGLVVASTFWAIFLLPSRKAVPPQPPVLPNISEELKPFQKELSPLYQNVKFSICGKFPGLKFHNNVVTKWGGVPAVKMTVSLPGGPKRTVFAVRKPNSNDFLFYIDRIGTELTHDYLSGDRNGGTSTSPNGE